MANVDYVIVSSGPSLGDVMNAVKAAASVIDVKDEHLYTRLRTSDERAELQVYRSHGRIVIEVYHVEDDDQRALSRRIYGYLVEHTAWDLTLDSDNAADTIASRVKAST